jgi:hypothetical protein
VLTNGANEEKKDTQTAPLSKKLIIFATKV